MTPSPQRSEPPEPPVLCTLCSWTGDVGAEAHAKVIHPGVGLVVVQMGRQFIVSANRPPKPPKPGPDREMA